MLFEIFTYCPFIFVSPPSRSKILTTALSTRHNPTRTLTHSLLLVPRARGRAYFLLLVHGVVPGPPSLTSRKAMSHMKSVLESCLQKCFFK